MEKSDQQPLGEQKRLQRLKQIEAEMLAKFRELDLYRADAPADYNKLDHEAKNAGKYFCTFPYPYMNGYLHLGE
jgi:leucyl-tRNA synthetase